MACSVQDFLGKTSCSASCPTVTQGRTLKVGLPVSLSHLRRLPVFVQRRRWDSGHGETPQDLTVVANHQAGKTWGLCGKQGGLLWRSESERGPTSSLKRPSYVHFCLPQAMPIQLPESASEDRLDHMSSSLQTSGSQPFLATTSPNISKILMCPPHPPPVA